MVALINFTNAVSFSVSVLECKKGWYVFQNYLALSACAFLEMIPLWLAPCEVHVSLCGYCVCCGSLVLVAL